MKTVKDIFYFVEDVMTITGLSRSKSYKIIADLNRELSDRGYSWDERVLEYDNELQREAKRTASAELRKMNARQVKIAMQLQEAALQVLARQNPSDMAPKDIIAYIKAATAIERAGREAEVEVTSAEVQKTAAEGPSTLADAINEAWRKRKEQNEP